MVLCEKGARPYVVASVIEGFSFGLEGGLSCLAVSLSGENKRALIAIAKTPDAYKHPQLGAHRRNFRSWTSETLLYRETKRGYGRSCEFSIQHSAQVWQFTSVGDINRCKNENQNKLNPKDSKRMV